MSQRKSKWASAPVLVVAISSPDPTIDPAKMSPGPKFLSIPKGLSGGFWIFVFAGFIGSISYSVFLVFVNPASWMMELLLTPFQ